MDKSITETLKKINIELKGAGILSIVLTFSISIFFLSIKTYAIHLEKEARILEYIPTSVSFQALEEQNKYFIYASKRGTKYYFYNCKSTIKEENKIFFQSEEAAKRAGYSLAKACE